MPPSHTPRKPPTWWLKNAKPASVASQRVPNINAMMPLVGATVDSQSRPMTAPNRMEDTAVTGGTGEIDEREDVALGQEISEPARGERADDVEQSDHRDGPAADLRGKTAIDQVSRHVDGDEGELETAGEEAEHEQDIGAVPDGLRECLPQRLWRRALRRTRLRRRGRER